MLNAFSKGVDRVVFGMTAVLLVAMTGLVIAAVFMRYVVEQAIIYSYDLSTLLFAWTVFLGISIAERDRAHLSIVNITDFLGERSSRIIETLRLIVLLTVSLGTAWFGLKLFGRATMQIPSMGISIGWLYLSMPLGFGLLSLEYLLRLVSVLRGPRTGAL